MKHFLIVVVDTPMNVSTDELAEDLKFTMGRDNGVAGGYIGEPEEHAFYDASSIEVFPTTSGGGVPL